MEIRTGQLTEAYLAEFPQSLQGRHACATWLQCRWHLAIKRQQLL
jgi:hypothetical protein